jgi:NADH-quinone oxidoreductase subunit N
MGAVSSGFLLFGVALVFITAQTLDFFELRLLFSYLDDKELPLLLVLAMHSTFIGFWFKLSISPFHSWTPDVYEGVLTPVTFFFSTVVKLGVFTFFVRTLFFLFGSADFVQFWALSFEVAALSSIVAGALGALRQTKIKRFIGYTTINQAGYLLIGLCSEDLFGLQASFLYLFI